MRKLTATYRLQMNASFTLAHARARVDYFARLGVSHLYLSPILAARAGSQHGYDVVDPSRVNPELGTAADLRAFAEALHAHDMGLVVDVVPNHMGASPENWRWEDVLEHGERSRYARWFDIDWGRAETRGKVILPVLGDTLDRVLERGELSVAVDAGAAPRLVYFHQSFPLDSATLPPELQLATEDPAETRELAALFSGKQGSDRLRTLLELQHYRLMDWRTGTAQLNYRRFFDVNDLVAVRVEDESVFRESHEYILSLARDAVVDAVRVDHIDGLYEPLEYLRRLRDGLPPGMPIFVEKILSRGEQLPREWPVAGTTGYEFMNELEDVFIDPDGYAAIEAAYRRLRRLPAERTFQSLARDDKLAVLRGSLRADVIRVLNAAAPLLKAAGHRIAGDALRAALEWLIASLDRYRTYIDGRSAVDDADRETIERATAAAAAAAPEHRATIELLRDLLLGTSPGADEAARLAFVHRFQQASGPAAAKGVEDTALYVYVPLVSRNEVGGAPDHGLAEAVERLHAANVERVESWPLTLNATNTHDTKRSADVRARIDALSEVPRDWERSVRRWRRLNARHRTTVKGRIAPDTNTEHLVYQILVALWPPPRQGRRSDDLPDRAWRTSVHERVARYALKAAREAKMRTSWSDPDAAYEQALHDFIGAILSPADDAPFLTDVARFVSRVAAVGAWNALSRVALHLTSPGTPDLYQGDELWNFTLVDPDNRQPVDYDLRERLISQSAATADLYDPRTKLLVTHRLLQLRRAEPDLFVDGGYEPLHAIGDHAARVIAFARTHGEKRIITVTPRLAAPIIIEPAETRWGDTRIDLPAPLHGITWKSVLDDDTVFTGGTLELGALLRTIPVAVLVG